MGNANFIRIYKAVDTSETRDFCKPLKNNICLNKKKRIKEMEDFQTTRLNSWFHIRCNIIPLKNE